MRINPNSEETLDIHHNSVILAISPYNIYDGQQAFSNDLGTTSIDNLQTQIDSDGSEDIPVIPDALRLALAIFLFVVFFIGVTGNVIVIWIISRTKALHKPNNVLIINLACSDLLMVISMFPTMFSAVAKKRWIFEGTGCDVHAFCGSLFGIGSLCTLTAIAYDRRCAVCNANNGTRSGSARRVYILAAVAWIYSLFWSVLPLTGIGGFVVEGYQVNCTFDYMNQSLKNKIYVGFLFAGAFFIPMSIIVYSYLIVIMAVKQSQQSLTALGKHALVSRSFRRRRHKRQVKNYETAKIGIKLIAMFLLSWGPYACVAFVGQYINPGVMHPVVQLLPVVMAKSASVWNPFVYAISHRRFKRELRGIILEKCFPVNSIISETDDNSMSNVSVVATHGSYCSPRRISYIEVASEMSMDIISDMKESLKILN